MLQSREKGSARQPQAAPLPRLRKKGQEKMKAFHEVRNYDSDFMVWQSCYEDISFLAHWHQELELIYVRSGQASFRINDDEFTASAGDLIFVDTGDFHYSDSYDFKNCLDFIVFDTGIISPHYRPCHFRHPLVSAAMQKEYGMEGLADRLFSQVSLELQKKRPYYREIVSALLREFLYRLRRCHPQSSEKASARSHRMEQFYDMQHLLTYIDEHYSEDITLPFAARKMNLSESHFSKTFKKLVGLNFIAYLNAVRIEQSAGMLRTSGAQISEIAMNCGFGNIRSFNRTFKNYTGYTPTEFMRLSESDAQHFSFYQRRLERREYVQNDSLTIVKRKDRGV